MIVNKLFKSGNYLIVEKDNGVDPIVRSEYSIGNTVYTRGVNGQFPQGVDQFQLLESGSPKAGGRLVIPLSEVTNGDWVEEDGLTHFTDETLTTFFRTNTGFNPASGGSDAKLEARLDISSLEILAGGFYQLLPTLVVGIYYRNVELILEFNGAILNGSYNFNGAPALVSGLGGQNIEIQTLMDQNTTKIAKLSQFGLNAGQIFGSSVNQGVGVEFSPFTPPTGGNGTLTLKASYELGTFG